MKKTVQGVKNQIPKVIHAKEEELKILETLRLSRKFFFEIITRTYIIKVDKRHLLEALK